MATEYASQVTTNLMAGKGLSSFTNINASGFITAGAMSAVMFAAHGAHGPEAEGEAHGGAPEPSEGAPAGERTAGEAPAAGEGPRPNVLERAGQRLAAVDRAVGEVGPVRAVAERVGAIAERAGAVVDTVRGGASRLGAALRNTRLGQAIEGSETLAKLRRYTPTALGERLLQRATPTLERVSGSATATRIRAVLGTEEVQFPRAPTPAAPAAHEPPPLPHESAPVPPEAASVPHEGAAPPAHEPPAPPHEPPAPAHEAATEGPGSTPAREATPAHESTAENTTPHEPQPEPPPTEARSNAPGELPNEPRREADGSVVRELPGRGKLTTTPEGRIRVCVNPCADPTHLGLTEEQISAAFEAYGGARPDQADLVNALARFSTKAELAVLDDIVNKLHAGGSDAAIAADFLRRLGQLHGTPVDIVDTWHTESARLAELANKGFHEVSGRTGGNQVTWVVDNEGRPVEARATLREVFSKEPRSSAETAAQSDAAGPVPTGCAVQQRRLQDARERVGSVGEQRQRSDFKNEPHVT